MDVVPTPKGPAVSSGSTVARCGAWKGNQPDSSVSNENAEWHCMCTRNPIMETQKTSSFLHCGCIWLEDKETLSYLALPKIPSTSHVLWPTALPQLPSDPNILNSFDPMHIFPFSPLYTKEKKNINGPLWFQAKYPRNVNRIRTAIILWPTVADHEFLLL